MKVSVIVPVFDPGGHLDKLVDSLLAQSLPAGELELIFVDDGSTDGTAARLDALAAAHAHVRVEHIPHSGWPARPRNVGLTIATGEFVFFADNDDWLGREALERLYATATSDAADVVLGKVVGHGKLVPPGVFVANRHDLTARDVPFELLAPHKLFRRALLERHGLRFPERRHALEDHGFVVPAFFHARRIAILADYPCYHWARRRGTNASSRTRDWHEYYAAVAEVLDAVDAHTEPGALRDRRYVRWLDGKLLGRVGSAQFVRRAPDERAKLFRAARELAQQRFAPHLDARLPYALRLRAALLRRGSLEGLEALGRFSAELRPAVRLRRIQGDGTWLTMRLTGRMPPLLVTRGDGGVRFEPPEPLRGLLQEPELDATKALADRRVAVMLHAIEDGVQWELPVETHVRLVPSAGALEPRVRMVARVAPTIAAGGAPLPPGEYEVRVRVALAGFTGTTPVNPPFTVTVRPDLRLEHRGRKAPPAPRLTRVRRLRRAVAAR